MSHVHHFRAITWGGGIALTRWHCSCGLKVRRPIAALLEGKAS